MKTSKILILTIVCILLFSSFVGCTEENGGDGDGDGDGNGNGGTGTYSNWYGFEFEQNVEANDEETGKLKEFRFTQVYNENGTVKEFDVTSTVMGKDQVDVKVQKMVIEGMSANTTTVEVTLEAYVIEHHIEVIRDDEGGSHPDWVELTVYLPEGDFVTSQYFWIYAMTEYEDSDGNQGVWSYYLNDDMLEEMESSNTMYLPYTEGDMNHYDAWVLYGLYGWAWTWFKPFTEDMDLEEGSINVPTPQGSFSYTITKTTETIGGYEFEAYNIKSNAVSFEGGAQLEGTFSPTLPVPIYVKVGGSGADYYSYYEIELTDVVLE